MYARILLRGPSILVLIFVGVHFEHLESMQDHMGIVNDPQLRKIVMDLQVTAPVHKISRTAKL